MALKKLEIDKGYESISCICCKQMKDIPVIRALKKCDDCFEKEYQDAENKIKEELRQKRVLNMRIPNRYINFIGDLEISNSDFEDLCEPGTSLAISGELGTGKTNLACQVLMHRGHGLFYAATEINKKIAEKIQDENLIVIDDLTEVESSKQSVVDALWFLFNHRYSECKDTIITLSKTYGEVERIFGDSGLALVSRFKRWMTPVLLKNKWR